MKLVTLQILASARKVYLKHLSETPSNQRKLTDYSPDDWGTPKILGRVGRPEGAMSVARLERVLPKACT